MPIATIQLTAATCLALVVSSLALMFVSLFVWQHGATWQIRTTGLVLFMAAVATLAFVVDSLAP